MNKIKLLFAALIAVVGVSVAVPVFASNVAFAASPTDSIKSGLTETDTKTDPDALQRNIKTITNVLLFILGAIAVIMIIIGGIRYATSNGDASSTKAAKDTILYAVVGLIVAILAYAIVSFVLDAFTE